MFWIQFSFPFVFQGDLWWRSRWQVYFLVYDFSNFRPNNFRNTINWWNTQPIEKIQFLYTSSIIISLEFVFSNLCLIISENLLSLSLQESPNLFFLSVVSLCFLSARLKSTNNGSLRSIMTDWRCVDVIVVEVIKKLSLVQGLLGLFDKSLCNEVIVGLITCDRLVLDCQGLQRKYVGHLSTILRKLKVSDNRNNRMIREMMKKEILWMEKSNRWDATLTARMKHKDDQGMNRNSNLNPNVRMSH